MTQGGDHASVPPATPQDMSRLAEVIGRRRAVLLARWTAEVRRRFAPEALTGTELLDYVPIFLDELVVALRHQEAGGVAVQASQHSVTARQHGRQRFRVGFDVKSVVREYGVLRDCILDLLEEEGVSVSLAEMRVLTQTITTGISEAVFEYQEDRELARLVHENRLRLAMEATELGTWELDPTTMGLELDGRARELLAFARDEAATYDAFKAHLHPGDRDRVHDLVVRALDPTSGGGFKTDYRTVGAGGVGRWLSARGQVIFDDTHKPLRFVGTLLDITERRREEESLAKRAEFQEQFVGIVSHDLRSPFSTIAMAAELLMRGGGLDEKQRAVVERILSASGRGTRMVRDLLDFTRARLSNEFPLNKAPCEFGAVVRQAIAEIRQAHPSREIELHASGTAEGSWDADRLAQVVTNLVWNALQHGQQGAPVRVTSSVDEATVTLTVWNAGPPIPAELRSMLFEPVGRDRAKSSAKSGLGLGLYIVDQIVLGHGGDIHVDSSEESGTTLTVRLPRQPVGQSTIAPSASPARAEAAPRPQDKPADAAPPR